MHLARQDRQDKNLKNNKKVNKLHITEYFRNFIGQNEKRKWDEKLNNNGFDHNVPRLRLFIRKIDWIALILQHMSFVA